ncbi:MAG TPA: 4-alpha-glucanotransferase, partial [Longimicrobium sp.]|nr:4-alpha-glucanotransferase [Longimicrobium sp.]
GFPPVHPEELRRSGYRYFIDSLRTVMPFAGALRFDHVMSLHRLYWIPPGFGAREGTYVRYRPDEYYAILSLESHRHRTRIVGEDLGTVPQEVRARMGRHHIGRMYVLQYEAVPTNQPPVGAVIPGSVASLNTHDMPPFRGFWEGADIADRQDLGLVDERAARAERRTRSELRDKLASFLTAEGWLESSTDEHSVLRAALAFLAAGEDWLTLAGLEDLWGEDRPQNVPGTSEERPNWRRRARLSLDELKRDPELDEILRTIDSIRRDPRNSHG